MRFAAIERRTIMDKASYVIKVTDKGTGTVSYLKYPRPVSQLGLESLGKYLTQAAALNPKFTPEKVMATVADRENQGPLYRQSPVVVEAQPWDAEVAYGTERKENTSQRFTFHVRCLADCVTAITFPRGTTPEAAMDYAKAHLDEIDTFSPPRITKVLEIVEGSGCLEDNYPPTAQVMCVDAAFTASVQTARCVKFSRHLTQEQADLFRSCLMKFRYGFGDNNAVTEAAVKLFNALAPDKGWDVTAEILDHMEPWERVMDYEGYDLEQGLPTCRVSMGG